jgi:hypothetical protein
MASLTYHKILELVLSMQWNAYMLQYWYPLECTSLYQQECKSDLSVYLFCEMKKKYALVLSFS